MLLAANSNLFKFVQMLQTDWRKHFYNATAAYRRSKKTVYGLGTALSAPLILGQFDPEL